MIKVIIKYRDYVQLLELKDKITVITGDSATGKSSMIKIGSLKKSSVMNIQLSDTSYDVVCIRRNTELNDTNFSEKRIYIIDEGVRINNEIAKGIKLSKNSYFILITRKLTGLSNLNYDIFSVKKLIEIEKRKFVLTNYMYYTHIVDDIKLGCTDTIVVEDSKRAYEWFSRLFSNLDVNMIVAGESLADKESRYTPGGKEKVCREAEHQLNTSTGRLLIIFDRCSFGPELSKLKALLDNDTYYKRILILSDYLSWEYLMLQTNMFKKYFKAYNINEPMFEEEYYELQLEGISRKYGVYSIQHSPSSNKAAKLAKCYYDACCCINRDKECYIGVSGDDKFKALLTGTNFERLLAMSGR